MKRRYEHEKYTFILFYIYALRSHLWSHQTPFYHNSWNLLFLSVTFDSTKHQLRPPFKTGHIGQLVVLSIRRASVRPKLILGSTKPLLKLKDHPCFGHYHNLQWVITQHLYSIFFLHILQEWLLISSIQQYASIPWISRKIQGIIHFHGKSTKIRYMIMHSSNHAAVIVE